MRTCGRRSGGAGADALVALALVACAGVIALGTLGGALGASIGRSAAGHGSAIAPIVVSEGAAAGALARLAELGHGEELAEAARQAERAAESAQAPADASFGVDLRPAATALFAERATKPVVRAWAALLDAVSEGHAVLMTEFTRAASPLLEPDQVARLLAKAKETDLGAVDYEPVDDAAMRAALSQALTPIEQRKRLSLLEDLVSTDREWLPRPVLEALARHPLSTPALLVELAGSTGGYVRWGVAANAAAPPEALLRLADDTLPVVPASVAQNPAATEDVLLRLATEGDFALRLKLVGRSDLPESVLSVLASDESAVVRSRAEAVGRRSDAMTAGRAAPPVTAPKPTPPLRLRATLVERAEVVRWGLDEGYRLRPSAIRTWDDFPRGGPSYSALGGLAPEAGRLEGARFVADGVEHQVRVLRSKGALFENGKYMGNCTATYCEQIDAGATVVVAIARSDAPDRTLYNVAWHRNADAQWAPGRGLELRARHEQPIESAEVLAAIDALTERLNAP